MKILANLGLAALFVLAIAAAGTAAVWKYAPEYIKVADERWVGYHTGKVRRAIVALREESKTDPKAAISDLEDLRVALDGYEKADRRYPLRRQALRLLADLHFNQGELEAAESAGAELVALDRNDIGTRLWFGKRLSHHQPTLERGIAELGSLFNMLPEAGVVARTYVESLRAVDRPEESAAALIKHTSRMLRPEQSFESAGAKWQVWWSLDGSLVKERRIDVEPLRYGDITAIGFELPEKAAILRLDPPMNSRLAYGAPRLGLFLDGGQIEVPIPSDELKLSDMYMGKDALYTFGAADPWVTMPVPAEHQGAPLHGRFVFKAERLPLWIGEAATEPAAQRLIDELGPTSEVAQALTSARESFLEVSATMAPQTGATPR